MKKGFANLSKEQIVELGKKGGHAAQATGKAHKFTSEEAKEAGRKGGLAKHKNKKDLTEDAK